MTIRLETRDKLTGKVRDIIQMNDSPSVFRSRRAVFETLDSALLAGDVVVITSDQEND